MNLYFDSYSVVGINNLHSSVEIGYAISIPEWPRWGLLLGVMGHIFFTVKCYTARIFTADCSYI